MATTGPDEVLSPDQRTLAERWLGDAWGGPVRLVAAATLWERDHVVRVTADDGRTAVLKRRRADGGGQWGPEAHGFALELASLGFLDGGSGAAVVPRLWGGDADRGVLVMEDLPGGRSLATSLLGTDAEAARAYLVAYAEALGALHAGSIGRRRSWDAARRSAGLAPGVDDRCWWVARIADRRDRFVDVARTLGLPVAGVAAEIDHVAGVLDGGPDGAGAYAGFVHGDPCPDNVLVVDGRARLIDFERSSWGSVALDAGYLVAPFPSCWCFGVLDDAVVAPALAAYRSVLSAAGVTLGPDWDADLAAAVAGWLVARTDSLAAAVDTDGQWGTTTMRPRLRTWAERLAATPAAAEGLPALHRLATALASQLAERWPDAVPPDYPPLAPPASPRPSAVAPDGWLSEA
jgi:Ser/Thr protein kinase RdoA (MazF antagonist)